jgi:Tol biopolymer transport system component
MANGTTGLWLQNVDGSGLRPLTKADAWPVWSPDGRFIMYAVDQQTMVVSADGGEPRKLIDGFFRGDWIARPDGQGTWAVSVVQGAGPGSAGIRLIDVERRVELWTESAPGLAHPMFNHDGSAISVGFGDSSGQGGIAVYDTATRKRRIAVRFPEPFHFYFRASWIDDDRGFAVNRYRLRSRVVMIDGLLPKR